MVKHLSLFCLILLSLGLKKKSHAQTSVADSLEVVALIDSVYYGKVPGISHGIQLFIRSWRQAEQLQFERDFIINRIVVPLAQDYSKMGDFDRSLELTHLCLDHFKSTGNLQNQVWVYNDQAIVYINKGHHQKANDLYKKALEMIQKHPKELGHMSVDIYDGLANTHTGLKQYEKAWQFLQLEKAELKDSDDPYLDELRLYSYFNQAEYFRQKGDAELAIQAYKKAIKIADNKPIRKASHAMIRLAELYMELEAYNKAEVQYSAAIQFYTSSDQFERKDAYLLAAYYGLAKVKYLLNQPQKSLDYVKQCDELGAYLHLQYLFNSSKFFLDDVRRKNLELGVQVCWELGQTNANESDSFFRKALVLMDRAKSNVLNERLFKNKKLAQAESDSVKRLRFQWSYLLTQFEREGNTKEAADLRLRIDSLDGSLGVNQFKDLNTYFLQDQIPKDEAALSYFVSDTSLFIFLISSDQIAMQRVQYQPQKIRQIVAWQSAPSSDIIAYIQQGHSLYQTLIVPLISEEVNTYTIIPDRALNLLAFNALPTSNNAVQQWQSIDYWGNEAEVTYEYSLTQLSNQRNPSGRMNYIGFATTFSDSGEEADLKYSDEVFKNATKVFNGYYFIGEEANVSHFLSNCTDANILHLYTHGYASDSSYSASYLKLQDQNLYVDQIMTLPIEADLCLLTACEVGMGKEQKAEGITGVSWAFRAAGASNIITSNWSLNEWSTAEVLKRFFSHLGDQSTSSALQKAQRDYLQNETISDRQKHPFYWAGMNHYGRGVELKTKPTNYWWYAFGLIGLVLMGWWYWRKV